MIPPIHSERLDLVSLPAEFYEAMLVGDRPKAERVLGVRVSPGWETGRERFMRGRLQQIWRDRSSQEWIGRAMVLREPDPLMIGDAGFHGPPDPGGTVEVGYGMLPEYWGRGFGTEAARALIHWAHAARGIRRFRASVSPANLPSLRIVAKLGFVRTGVQWDEEDGEETVHELNAENGLPWIPRPS